MSDKGDGDEASAINKLNAETVFDDDEPPTKKIRNPGADGSNRASKRKGNRKQGALKRFKKTNPNNDEAAKCLMSDTLFGCTDVVSEIFSFLDVRQLLRFVCVSKEFKSLLTYDHVIRSTMLSGGFPPTSLQFMAAAIRNRKIWIPSPIRLLRAVCGKRCERCDSQNRFVCDSFGVFLCKKCTNSSTKLFRRTKQWKDYLDAPRVSLGPQKGSNGKSNMYLMLTPMKDAAGNPIGPLVTAQDLETMANDKDWSSKTPTEKVAAWMKKCDDQQPQSDAAVKAILKALEDNREDATNRRTAVWKEKVDARNQFGAARRKKSDELMANLMDLLKDEDPDIIAQVNSKSWSNRYNQYTFPYGTIVHKLLTPVFRAPSKYSAKKKLKQVADQLVLVSGEKKLMDMYIQRIVDHCDHPDTDDKVLRRNYQTSGFQYSFPTPAIRDILKEQFSKPRDLNDESVQQLADQVKMIVHRRAPGEEVLQKLDEQLKDLWFENDLRNRNWNSWNWSWMFKETYIQDILYEPICKPEDITEERLGELEQQMRSAMEKKKLIHDRIEHLLAPVAKKYPEWYTKLKRWRWNSRENICTFSDFGARQILGGNKELEHVEEMDDAKIEKLSKSLLTSIESRLSS